MSFFIEMIGAKGMIGLIGLITFLFVYKYSIGIFDWFERQTYGTRTYVAEKLEFLFIEIPDEKLTMMLMGCSVGLGMLLLLIFGTLGFWKIGLVFGGLGTFYGFKIPKLVIDNMVKKRIDQYSGQMVDALTLLANGVRAGLSLNQAVGMVVDEMPRPISQEFNVILQQNKIGVPLEECFDNLAKRVPLEDNDMFVSSVNVLRETGGNLAETFDTIVSVIRERVRLKQKIDTATAQSMMQSYIMSAMPGGMFLIFFMMDPDGMSRIFKNTVGIVMLLVALAFNLTGFFVIKKLVKIDV